MILDVIEILLKELLIINHLNMFMNCFQNFLQFTFLSFFSQVIDLHDMKPENALEWCHLLPDTVFRVIVCGGDGSVGWVLSAIENLKLQVHCKRFHSEILLIRLASGLTQVL